MYKDPSRPFWDQRSMLVGPLAGTYACINENAICCIDLNWCCLICVHDVRNEWRFWNKLYLVVRRGSGGVRHVGRVCTMCKALRQPFSQSRSS